MSPSELQAWANPRRILLATDLSDLPYTLPIALQQAQTHKAELRIAHVLPNPSAPLIDPVLMVYCEPDRISRTAEKAIEEALEKGARAGVHCSSHLSAGDVTNEIIEVAHAWKADRLIAGSHGKAKFHLHILGSVAESLFHHIDIPVLAIGPHCLPAKTAAEGRMRIVFATRLDDDSRNLAQFALRVAEGERADLSLVHVRPEAGPGHSAAALGAFHAEKLLQDLAGVVAHEQCGTVCEVLQGQPANAIVEYARRHSADLIILGASGQPAFDPRFLPGTAYRVLCESPCPVLVLKQDSTWAANAQETTHSGNMLVQ